MPKSKPQTLRRDKQPIPSPQPIDRELVERLKEQARRIIAEQRDTIKAMLHA
jgi:hypothetical protein